MTFTKALLCFLRNDIGNAESELARWQFYCDHNLGHRSAFIRNHKRTELSEDSFHWLGEALQPDGENWKLEGEFRAKRVRMR